MSGIEVTTRLVQDGKAIPVSIYYNQTFYRVESVGRDWEDEEGHHILVQVTPGQHVYEILRDLSGKWRVVKGHDRPTVTLT